MELELGLALPNHNPMMIQGVDLNRNNSRFEPENCKEYSQKQVFLEDHGIGVESTTLSLLSWSRQEMEDDPPKWRKPHEIDDDEEIKGRPPTDSWCQGLPEHRRSNSTAVEQVVRKSMHVKVKMEGVAIGRKVDLRNFDSYHALTNTLIDMFSKYSKIERNREEYSLLYLDKEGDRMLVGDVEWEEFVDSVRRVEILKNDNKMGFRLLSRKT